MTLSYSLMKKQPFLITLQEATTNDTLTDKQNAYRKDQLMLTSRRNAS